jgi:hypothetical protein
MMIIGTSQLRRGDPLLRQATLTCQAAPCLRRRWTTSNVRNLGGDRVVPVRRPI